MLVADKDVSFTLTGVGDVIAPHDGIMSAGSGGGFALGEGSGARFCCRTVAGVLVIGVGGGRPRRVLCA